MTILSKLRERVSVCALEGDREQEGPRDSEEETERERERIQGDPPVTSPSHTFSRQGPCPTGPIHVSMSSLSNLGLTVQHVMGYQRLAGRQAARTGMAGLVPVGKAPWQPLLLG